MEHCQDRLHDLGTATELMGADGCSRTNGCPAAPLFRRCARGGGRRPSQALCLSVCPGRGPPRSSRLRFCSCDCAQTEARDSVTNAMGAARSAMSRKNGGGGGSSPLGKGARNQYGYHAHEAIAQRMWASFINTVVALNPGNV
eukprot:Selendium_serpulae@DN6457_c0_g2_i3.p2